ncbi:cellulose-binding domain-containing protein [Saccharothrix sp. MB29]|nr:cellulose-binding domain-containing protein [Saccharothrix sp. MB29]
MSKIRWHVTAAAVAVATLAVGLVVAPAASGAGGVSATFTKGSDWGTGYEGKYTIRNGSSAALSTWTVEFDLPAGARVSSIWDGSQTTSGQHVTVKPTWNGSVGTGGSVSFGFIGSWNGTNPAPTSFALNGATCATA